MLWGDVSSLGIGKVVGVFVKINGAKYKEHLPENLLDAAKDLWLNNEHLKYFDQKGINVSEWVRHNPYK